MKEIQHSSDNLIISSEEGTGKIITGWELSNKLQGIFEEILSSSEISATSAEKIATSIKQQVSAFEQILITLKQISEGIDNFVISTKSTTKASISLKEMVDNLNNSIDEYKVDVGPNDYRRNDTYLEGSSSTSSIQATSSNSVNKDYDNNGGESRSGPGFSDDE